MKIVWEDLSDIESFKERLAIRTYEIRQKLYGFRHAMFRQQLNPKDYPDVLNEIPCPAELGEIHWMFHLKGIYHIKKGKKGAMEMLDWRNHCYIGDTIPAIIVAHDKVIAVYSVD